MIKKLIDVLTVFRDILACIICFLCGIGIFCSIVSACIRIQQYVR